MQQFFVIQDAFHSGNEFICVLYSIPKRIVTRGIGIALISRHGYVHRPVRGEHIKLNIAFRKLPNGKAAARTHIG